MKKGQCIGYVEQLGTFVEVKVSSGGSNSCGSSSGWGCGGGGGRCHVMERRGLGCWHAECWAVGLLGCVHMTHIHSERTAIASNAAAYGVQV